MAGTDQHHARAIGERLRAVRQAHKLSLRELARKADMSASMLSLVETGKAFPSVRSLYNLATALGVTVDHFFPDQGLPPAAEGFAALTAGDLSAGQPGTALLNRPMPSSPIVHADRRPTIQLDGGVSWSRLTALAEQDTEFLEINYAPGAASGLTMSHHGGREFGLILQGELTVELAFDSFTLQAGDSIIFEATTPHRLSNKGSCPLRAIWVVIKIP